MCTYKIYDHLYAHLHDFFFHSERAKLEVYFSRYSEPGSRESSRVNKKRAVGKAKRGGGLFTCTQSSGHHTARPVQ